MKEKKQVWGGICIGLVFLALLAYALHGFNQPGETERKLSQALVDIERLDAAWKQWHIEQGVGGKPAPDLKELSLYIHTPGTKFTFPLDQFVTGRISFSRLCASTRYQVFPPLPEANDPFGNPYFTGTLSKEPALHPATYAIALRSKDPARFLAYAP